eukprot:TRINITY_DN1670_c0_g1_i1.p1 TRINITY_DN1670_c0_g1~~TRINITY_DN1670_c0_g1_i1.p1  ORF type:complete len:215 (-),score=35.96 TRINITY_DN1670_c0_g1_i1:224-868(-)
MAATRKRSFMGWVCGFCTTLLRVVNLVVLMAAIACISLSLVMESTPSFPGGWGLLFLSGVTALSGLFGVFSNGSVMGCFGLHLFCLMMSTSGLCAGGVVVLVRTSEVLASMSPQVPPDQARRLLQVLGALFVCIFAVQLVVLLLSCLIHTCGLGEIYDDDLEKPRSAKELAKIEREAAKVKAKIEATSAHQLAEKMKQKYSGYNQSSDYEVEKK